MIRLRFFPLSEYRQKYSTWNACLIVGLIFKIDFIGVSFHAARRNAGNEDSAIRLRIFRVRKYVFFRDRVVRKLGTSNHRVVFF